MNRASGAAAARATDRLLGKSVCGCDQAIDLQTRSRAAVGFIVAAINELDKIPSTTIVGDAGPDAATLALINARKALSALECES